MSKSYRVLIIGHTDDRGQAAYNESLSKKRANSVLQYLITQGISQNRLTSIGFGEEKPIASNAAQSGRAKNRRVEFQLITID